MGNADANEEFFRQERAELKEAIKDAVQNALDATAQSVILKTIEDAALKFEERYQQTDGR